MKTHRWRRLDTYSALQPDDILTSIVFDPNGEGLDPAKFKMKDYRSNLRDGWLACARDGWGDGAYRVESVQKSNKQYPGMNGGTFLAFRWVKDDDIGRFELDKLRDRVNAIGLGGNMRTPRSNSFSRVEALPLP